MRTQAQARPVPQCAETLDAFEGLLNAAHAIVVSAGTAGVPIRFLGIAGLDDQARGYPGTKTDWIVLPVGSDPLLHTGSMPMPRHARRDLSACRAVVDFPVMLIAHEVPKGAVTLDIAHFDAGLIAEDPVVRGAQLLQALPSTAAATQTGRRIATVADAATQVGGALLVGTLLGGALAAGTIAGGGLLLAAALAAGGLDPILVGALPWRGETTPGTPTALFEITRWTW